MLLVRAEIQRKRLIRKKMGQIEQLKRDIARLEREKVLECKPAVK